MAADINGATWTTDARVGAYALDYDGSNDYVDTNYSLTQTAGVSIGAWVRWQGASGDTGTHWILHNRGASGGHLALGLDGGSLVFSIDPDDGTGADTVTATTDIRDGAWYLVCGVYDDGTATVSVDGTEEASTTGLTAPALGSLTDYRLGANRETLSEYWDGVIDDVHIHETALQAIRVEDWHLYTHPRVATAGVTGAGAGTSGSASGVGAAVSVTTPAGAGAGTTASTTIEVAGTAVPSGAGASTSGSASGVGAAVSVTTPAGAGDGTPAVGPVDEVTDTLMAWYKLDEGSGTTAADSADSYGDATAQDGTISGATWTATAKTGGQALDFDGIDDRLETTYTLTDASAVTLGCWLQWHGSAGDTNRYWVIDSGDTSNLGFRLDSGVIECVVDVPGGGNAQTFTGSTDPRDGAWYHVVFVFDDAADTGTLYVNGSQDGQDTNLTNSPAAGETTTFWVGENRAGGQNFDGIIDDVRIYETALTPTQVSDWYDNTV